MDHEAECATWEIRYIQIDFLMMGPKNLSECFRNVAIMQAVCEQTRLPIEPTKSASPASLGIENDTIQGMLRLPADKLTTLKDTLRHWCGSTSFWKKELLSLNGLLVKL